ncbi:hypothetical protein Agub_g6156, partial [Astrephomene gubernaculifera]
MHKRTPESFGDPPPNAARVWIPGVVDHIISFLPRNFVACTIRLLDKSFAAEYSKFNIVRLSEPTPTSAFARQWSDPANLRALTFKQRLQLLCLTSRSGSLPNLALAVANAGIVLTSSSFSAMFTSAVVACQFHICEWLIQQGCCPPATSLKEAARAGSQASCEWLLAHGCPWSPAAVYAAARGGHVGLMEWLLLQPHQQQHCLARCPVPAPASSVNPFSLLVALVEGGCSLALLQHRYLHLTTTLANDQQPQQHQQQHEVQWSEVAAEYRRAILKAAAASPGPDWQAKVAWLEAQGFPRCSDACTGAAACPDALERLTWLLARGYPANAEAATASAREGNAAALGLLLTTGGVHPGFFIAQEPAARGHLEVLAVLHSLGYRLPVEAMQVAAENGHVAVVQWLFKTAQLGGSADVAASWAARSGRLEVVGWLRQQQEYGGGGCDSGWAPGTVASAAEGGSGEMMEWLVKNGCPFRVPAAAGLKDPYVRAARNGDLATLRCLHRLGCPWDAAGSTFT